jgi:hypothetical protein
VSHSFYQLCFGGLGAREVVEDRTAEGTAAEGTAAEDKLEGGLADRETVE